MRYQKRSEDQKYRIINVNSAELAEFRNFEDMQINYPDTGCVLEIQKEDGSVSLAYEAEKIQVSYASNEQEKKIYIRDYVPTDRLWLRAVGKGKMWYKVPMKLNKRDGYAYMQLSCNPLDVELCGDKYFETVFELKRD